MAATGDVIAASTGRSVRVRGPEAAAARLHAYIRTNLVAVIFALAWLVMIRLLLAPSVWVSVLVGLLAALSAALVRADRLVTDGCHESAVIWVAAGNWATAIAAAAIAPSAFQLLPAVMLFPTLLAIPYLGREKLTEVQGATVIAVLALAAAGMLGPGAGLEQLVPSWLLDLLNITFIPVTTGLACVLAWHNHLVLAARTQAAYRTAGRLVAAADGERRRIERDLHDGAQQRLIALAMQLRVARRLHTSDPDQTMELIDRLVGDVQTASAELRDLSHGIYPPQLTEQGLPAALRATLLTLPVTVTLRCDDIGRYPAEVESAVYFSCVEGLQNTVKHAGPGTHVTLTLTADHGLTFDLRDDGVGCDPATIADGHGLRNIRDRIGAIGGTVTITGQLGAGLHLHADIPVPEIIRGVHRRTTGVRGATLRFLGGVWSIALRVYGPVRVGETDQDRLVAAFDVPLRAVIGSVPVILGTYVIVRSPWVWVIAGLSLAATGGQLIAVSAARAGRPRVALIACTATVWTFAVLLTAIVPILLPQLIPLLLLPVILAIPYTRRGFLPVMMVTVVVSALLATIGALAPGVGVQQLVPDWLFDVVVIAFLAANVVICLIVDWLNHIGLEVKSAEVRASQMRLVAAADGERRRIERDLHDGAQQRLIALAMQLRVARRLHTSDPDQTMELIDRLVGDVQTASAELRDLSHGIYPPQLTEQGLPAALRATLLTLPVTVTLRCDDIGRYPAEVESAVYFSCVEGLQNTVKHAGPGTHVTLTLTADHGLTFDLRDDGVGCDPATIADGHGLRNIRDRIGAIGGTVTITGQLGAGLHLHADTPQGIRSAAADESSGK